MLVQAVACSILPKFTRHLSVYGVVEIVQIVFVFHYSVIMFSPFLICESCNVLRLL